MRKEEIALLEGKKGRRRKKPQPEAATKEETYPISSRPPAYFVPCLLHHKSDFLIQN